MHPNFSNLPMIDWLKTQIRVMEAWRADLASRPEIDIAHLTELETHYQWLTAEVARLEDSRISRAA